MMGRIRTIKPEFCLSESMSKLSHSARLTFILLWTFVDDSGRARGSSRVLASILYPYEPAVHEQIDGWLDELIEAGCLDFYEVDGSRYVQVRNWLKHQKIDHPSASKIPPLANPRDRLASVRDILALDQGSGIRDLGPMELASSVAVFSSPVSASTSTKEDFAPRRRVEAKRPDDVPEQVWADWLAHRKAKRAPATATVLEQFRKEAAKAGVSLETALRESVARGWQGFRADWWKRDNATANTHRTDFGAVNYREGADADGRF